jgi:hypothetical protein
MSIQQVQFDLSGTKGLANRFYGDKNLTASQPNLRYLGGDGQLAEGVFNPITTLGYLSPANNTTKVVTGTTSYLLSSAIIVPQRIAEASTDAIFFSDEAVTGTTGKIMNLDTAIDTSLDQAYEIPTFNGYLFETTATDATNIITPYVETLNDLGIENASAVKYLSTTQGGLTQNTTYYVGNISGQTFKLYAEVGLSTLIEITSNLTELQFETVPGSSQYTKSEDFALYQLNGTPKIYFTRHNTTTNAVGDSICVASTVMGSPDVTWSLLPITVANNARPAGAGVTLIKSAGRIVFIPSDNGFLYVLNGNVVHKIDGGITGGTYGTITPRVLQFSGNTARTGVNVITRLIDGIDFRGKMYIGLHVNPSFDTRTSSITGKTIPMFVGVYVWNRSSTVASMQDFIEIVGVKELKSIHKFQGQPSCFTISVDGYTQFRVWNGTEFKVVKTLGQNAYPVYRRHSVHENGDNIMWLGNDGKIYCYGKIEEGLENALYILGDMSLNVTNGQTYSGSGVFIAANATETVTTGNQAQPLAFYLSYTDTAGNHLKKWYPYSTDTVATIAQTGHIGNVYTLVKYLPDMSTVKYVDIRCAPTGTGTTEIATIKYYFNGSATSSFSKVITKDQASRGYIRHEINKPYCNAIQMEIEYSTTNTLGASNDFRPSLAVVTYEDSNTKG